ncbi:MAG: 50S ribosomal protein L23 [Candidatus Omnitrophota bacterium]|nr:50S ribosomal protein L23 [Candidatus Omnitrophota bacterium]
MKDSYSIVRYMLITEKSTKLGPFNKYFFSVDVKANKLEIKKAVEDIYKVKVNDVNTMKVRGKKKRVRFQEGRTSNWKKAIVTLAEGQSIEIT